MNEELNIASAPVIPGTLSRKARTGLIVAALLSVILGLSMGLWLPGLWLRLFGAMGTASVYALSAVIELVMIGLPALFLLRLSGPLSGIRLRLLVSPTDSFDAGLTTVAAVSFPYAGAVLTVVWWSFLTMLGLTPKMTQLPNPQTVLQWVASVIGAALIPALVEEALFRGCCLDMLLRWVNKGWALVLSALIFAVFHFSVEGFLALFAVGLVLGQLYLKHRSLTLAIIFHFVHNLTAIIINASGVEPTMPIILVCVILFTFSMRALIKEPA